ncbi:histidine phosphatase family protein [uncultured Roseobacter sp.]|uniref:histidine phosphatase family protein n=1 Tax=uncultured Roseobacter sp. TaxID=114847 RepID=UPI0026177A6B|nr:histidine phosphatase family protein [uncultured Roseobacter sp.]
MTFKVRYLSHPQVLIDPAKDVTRWSLNETGHARVARLAASGRLADTTRIISSAETKALETAQPLADALNCPLETRADMHENDRSATGFLPPDAFEQMADRFFAEPDQSAAGWETARAAQARICAEVEACLDGHTGGDLLFVGHGAVGTLLYCALAGVPISRTHDQGPGGGGNYYAFDADTRRPGSGWRPMEELI